MFGVGIGAQGACGFEVFDRLAGLVAFDEPPTDPVAGLGAQVGAEVGDIFQKPLIAVHHFRDVVFLAAQARRFEPRERHQIFRGRWVGDELVVIGECLARLGDFGVGRCALGDRRGNARIIRKARDEFVERANRTRVVAGFGKAPCALIEKSRQIFCTEEGGVDLRIDLRGLGGFLFRKQRFGLHHHGCVDARVLGVGFFVKLQKRIDLFRHELSFDLEEAE